LLRRSVDPSLLEVDRSIWRCQRVALPSLPRVDELPGHLVSLSGIYVEVQRQRSHLRQEQASDELSLLEAKIEVRETFVRGRFTTPKSRASRRVVELGPRTLAVLEKQWRRTAYRGEDDLVFGHPTKGMPLETGKLTKHYLRPALARAGIEKPFRPFHDLRHTSLTHAAAAGNPQIYVQARAGHSQGSITERYMNAAQVLFPDAAAKSEERMFSVLPDEGSAAADD